MGEANGLGPSILSASRLFVGLFESQFPDPVGGI